MKKLYDCDHFIVATSREEALRIYIDFEYGEEFGREVTNKFLYRSEKGDERVRVEELIKSNDIGIISSIHRE